MYNIIRVNIIVDGHTQEMGDIQWNLNWKNASAGAIMKRARARVCISAITAGKLMAARDTGYEFHCVREMSVIWKRFG